MCVCVEMWLYWTVVGVCQSDLIIWHYWSFAFVGWEEFIELIRVLGGGVKVGFNVGCDNDTVPSSAIVLGTMNKIAVWVTVGSSWN